MTWSTAVNKTKEKKLFSCSLQFCGDKKKTIDPSKKKSKTCQISDSGKCSEKKIIKQKGGDGDVGVEMEL